MNTSLRGATVQDIQLELLRRTRFNALDGERVCASLLGHRELWVAVLLDRPGGPNYATPSVLLTAGLIKLRDLPDNLWNADTLFVLTPTAEAAEQLAKVIEAEDWGGETRVYGDREETDRALGTGAKHTGWCPCGGTDGLHLHRLPKALVVRAPQQLEAEVATRTRAAEGLPFTRTTAIHKQRGKFVPAAAAEDLKAAAKVSV